jgi:hypothetical protein
LVLARSLEAANNQKTIHEQPKNNSQQKAPPIGMAGLFACGLGPLDGA